MKHDLERFRKLLDVPPNKAGFHQTSGRFDGINHWSDLLECQDLLAITELFIEEASKWRAKANQLEQEVLFLRSRS